MRRSVTDSAVPTTAPPISSGAQAPSSAAEVTAAYGAMVVTGAELAAFRPMVDLFCLPEACLISDVIQHFVDRGMPFHPGYVYQDVKAAVGYLHESGVLRGTISADPGKCVCAAPVCAGSLAGMPAAMV